MQVRAWGLVISRGAAHRSSLRPGSKAAVRGDSRPLATSSLPRPASASGWVCFGEQRGPLVGWPTAA